MTIFRFDELTWPEISALPRETPLILPLGNPPDEAAISTLFHNPQPVWVASFHPIWLAR